MALGIRGRFSLFILGSVMLILSSTMILMLLVIRQFSIEDARDFSLTILEETSTKVTTFVTEVEYLARSLSEYRVVREMKTGEFRDLFLSQVLPRRRYIRAIYVGTAAAGSATTDRSEIVGVFGVDILPTHPVRDRALAASRCSNGSPVDEIPLRVAEAAFLGRSRRSEGYDRKEREERVL